MMKHGTKYYIKFCLDVSASEGPAAGLKTARWIAEKMEQMFKEKVIDMGPGRRMFKIYKKGPRGGMRLVPFKKKSTG